MMVMAVVVHPVQGGLDPVHGFGLTLDFRGFEGDFYGCKPEQKSLATFSAVADVLSRILITRPLLVTILLEIRSVYSHVRWPAYS
jgi:hypothetical protein